MGNNIAEVVVHTSGGSGNRLTPSQRKEQRKKEYENRRKFYAVASSVSSSIKIANDAIGAYTGNRNRQRYINNIISVSSMAVLSSANPMAGLLAIGGYGVKSAMDTMIDVENAKQQANYNRSYLGNMTSNGSRWRGGN